MKFQLDLCMLVEMLKTEIHILSTILPLLIVLNAIGEYEAISLGCVMDISVRGDFQFQLGSLYSFT